MTKLHGLFQTEKTNSVRVHPDSVLRPIHKLNQVSFRYLLYPSHFCGLSLSQLKETDNTPLCKNVSSQYLGIGFLFPVTEDKQNIKRIYFTTWNVDHKILKCLWLKKERIMTNLSLLISISLSWIMRLRKCSVKVDNSSATYRISQGLGRGTNTECLPGSSFLLAGGERCS